jgi:ribosome-associated translation inhibitor RaiA
MDVQVIFQNLSKSELVKQIVHDRVESVLEKFPQTEKGKAVVYLSMENSPHQAGRDLFKVKVMLKGLKMKPIILAKHSKNLYEATAQVVDSLFENFHRHSEKLMTKKRSSQRRLKSLMRRPVQFS